MDGQMDRSPLSVCVQKFPTDKAYFIAKELLTTERTYLKDLQVITEVKRTNHLFFFLSVWLVGSASSITMWMLNARSFSTV